jgi:beta-galactosidase/beta-glucuronidase
MVLNQFINSGTINEVRKPQGLSDLLSNLSCHPVRLWSPEKPTLIDAEVQLWHEDKLLDVVKSYTAMRTVGIQRDRFMLNGRPYYLRLVLDQGYWPDTLMTAPSDEALRRDVELVKKMGFNGVRKHQKIADCLSR